MSYKTKTIPCNKGNYGGKRSVTTFLVLHYTANNGDTAIDNGNYFKNNVVKASANYIVDETTVVSSVPENYIAYHVGATKYYNTCRNSNSIGIELCSRIDSKGNYYFKDEVVANAVELVRSLVKKYNIAPSNIIRHYDVTHKQCPAPFVQNTIAWKNFLNKVTENIAIPKEEVKLQQWGSQISNIERIAYIPMSGFKGNTVSDAAKSCIWNNRYPDAICNAELFDMITYTPSSGLVANGIEEKLNDTLGFALVDNKVPVLSYKNNLKAKDWIGAYPMLVRDSKKAFDAVPSGLGGKRARTALAINNSVCAIVYVKATDGCTLEDFADAIIARGFHTAINLDGGGSTACITPGVAYDQGRKVRGKIGIWIKNGVGNKLAKNKDIKETIAPNQTPKIHQVKVVTKTGVGLNCRLAPEGTVIEVLQNGSVHTYLEESKKVNNAIWYKIKTSSNKIGWINSNYVILL